MFSVRSLPALQCVHSGGPQIVWLSHNDTIFHQDNAPAHKSVLALGKLRDVHYELLQH